MDVASFFVFRSFARFADDLIYNGDHMRQYFTGFFTAACLTSSIFIFMGSKNKNLGQKFASPPRFSKNPDSWPAKRVSKYVFEKGFEFQSATPAKNPTAVLSRTKKVILGCVISR